jgi:GNAT superfamily N-acetyltransferase
MVSLLERLEIVQQPKQEADALRLLDEVRRSPFIGEISSDELARLLRLNAVLFFYDGDTLAGLAGWDMIDEAWVELGPFYTAQAYRGQGLGSLMFDTVERMCRDAGHRLYAVTKNPVVKQMFMKRGFRQVRMWTLPREVQVHLLKKVTLRNLLLHVRKLSFRDSVSHFIKIQVQESA